MDPIEPFTIDIDGSDEPLVKTKQEITHDTTGPPGVLTELLKFKHSLRARYEKKEEPKLILNVDETEQVLEELGWNHQKDSSKECRRKKNADDLTINIQKQEAQLILQKSVVLKSGFEKLQVVPPYEISKRKALEERRKEREKTKGKKWFGLPATEITEDVKLDLEILQMRSVLDPKRFYKKNDLKVLPKYFQIGKVLDSPLDFYNNRLSKKERKKTLVDELLADAEFQKYNKRKYKEIIEEKQKTHYKAWRHAKRLKKKN
ncbi:deoxynucleotidyltransferase terminal-interacting protein 2 [Cylas formicarius]|uniref:deoxynucleotidyltransferase terminal-interacting protein 2 n=1 Tax=Cylas formicarius TaxID=197179 RepID=UPI0029587E2F|nr:deoxynucleotidyltransferase terminal-interacting protein 2 [Cylas formicarius]